MTPELPQPLEPAELANAMARERLGLERFLWGLLREREAVADALQTTFLRLVEHQRDVDPAKLRAWLFRVAHNEALRMRRRWRTEQEHLHRLAREQEITGHIRAAETAWWQTPADQNPPEDSISVAETRGWLRARWRELPVELQQIVTLRIEENLKFAEIAERLKLPLGTVLTRMRTALGRLRESLEELD